MLASPFIVEGLISILPYFLIYKTLILAIILPYTRILNNVYKCSPLQEVELNPALGYELN